MYMSTPRIFADSVFTKQAPSPVVDAANLFAFLVNRFNGAVEILGCPQLLGFPSPLNLVMGIASAEHLEQFSREDRARFTPQTTIPVDATFSESIMKQVEAIKTPETDAFPVGESAMVAPAAGAAATTSYLIPLIAVSAVLGGVAITGTTVVAVKKVRERRLRKQLAVTVTTQGTKQLNYVTDISNGYPIPSPRLADKERPNSPSPKDRTALSQV